MTDEQYYPIPDNILRILRDAAGRMDKAQTQAAMAIDAAKSLQAQSQMLLIGYAHGLGLDPTQWVLSPDQTRLTPKPAPPPPEPPAETVLETVVKTIPSWKNPPRESD